MSIKTPAFRPLLFVLPLLALSCNGSSPTEPLRNEPQPKAAVVSNTAGSGASSASVELASGDELRPGAARLALRPGARPNPSEDTRPTEPTDVAMAARGGNGNGGNGGHGNGGNGGGSGHGNGGGGNGGGGNGGGHGGRGGELSLEIQPDAWNTNWVHSEGTVQAFVRGGDAAKIDTDKVELVAPSGDSLAPTRARVAGGQLVAFFAKSDAFELLGKDVHSGDKITLKLRVTVGDQQQELSDNIRIVGPEPSDDDGGDDDNGGELELNIQPDDWNTNWAHSAGQVKAFLRGDGLKDVDLDTVRLVGDKADAKPLKPVDVRRVGHQIVASFLKSAAYATLDDPDSGETHTVKITFKQKDADKELSEDVHIEGP
jgi:hypothetical protein